VCYTACFDGDDVMELPSSLLGAVVRRVVPDGEVRFKARPLNFAAPFRRVSMKDGIDEVLARHKDELLWRRALLDSPEQLEAWLLSDRFKRFAEKAHVDAGAFSAMSHGKRVALLFESFVEGDLWDPTFVTDYPTEVSPLAKARPDDPTTTERFELYAAGMEIANGFSELNDPLEQRQRFLDQLEARAHGDLEAHQMDEDYVRALGHGLPPTGGCGVGVDRLAMILTDSPSIRDVILFPLMRPEGGRS
jgi:lysyl-tRNA synthetase class 2